MSKPHIDELTPDLSLHYIFSVIFFNCSYMCYIFVFNAPLIFY